MKRACRTCKWVMLHAQTTPVTPLNRARHIWNIRHFTHLKRACCTCKWVMLHAQIGYAVVTNKIWMSSRHIYHVWWIGHKYIMSSWTRICPYAYRLRASGYAVITDKIWTSSWHIYLMSSWHIYHVLWVRDTYISVLLSTSSFRSCCRFKQNLLKPKKNKTILSCNDFGWWIVRAHSFRG